MKTACMATVVLSLAVGSAYAAELQTFSNGTWLCDSPKSYDLAIERARGQQGEDLRGLQKELREKKLCMYIDDDDVEDIMAPFVTVTETQGDKVKVSFTVEYFKKIKYLHRKITQVTYAGWTDAGNLTNAY